MGVTRRPIPDAARLAELREWHDPDMVRPTEYRDLGVEIELSNGSIVEGRYCGDNSWKVIGGGWLVSANVVRWRELL